MSLFRDSKWSGILTTGLVAFSSGITLYLLISDGARRSEIRRRKNAVLADDVSTAAQERFAALRIGGRFVNPFEECSPFGMWGLIVRWREQGAWEWVMWKVLTCFKFNLAGLPRNRKVCLSEGR